MLDLGQARRLFLSSRIRVSRAAAAAGEGAALHLRCHLEFTDWLEALVRLSTATPLPTDAELRAAGSANALVFLRDLRASPAR